MAKIKIKDLPKDEKISEEEMRKVMGGDLPIPIQRVSSFYSIDLRRQYTFATPIEIP